MNHIACRNHNALVSLELPVGDAMLSPPSYLGSYRYTRHVRLNIVDGIGELDVCAMQLFPDRHLANTALALLFDAREASWQTMSSFQLAAAREVPAHAYRHPEGAPTAPNCSSSQVCYTLNSIRAVGLVQ